jgi:excisionase family DNA binding protein
LLTTPEAARLLRVHRNTLDREREAGRVKYVRIGRRVFFTEDHLSDYLNNQSDTNN